MDTFVQQPPLTQAYLYDFLAERGFPDVVIVRPRDYAQLLADQGLADNRSHEVDLLGTIWRRGASDLRELDWSGKKLGGPNAR